MSGLIWSALGQGLANVGQSVGGMMAKGADEEMRQQAEDRKEANYIKRLEEAQRIKDEAAEKKAEELNQRVIKETTAAQAAGAAAPSARAVSELRAKAGPGEGEDAMSDEQLQAAIKNNPALRKSYEESGLITKKDSRLETAEAAVSSAMGAGAHSSTIKNLQDLRSSTLKEIQQEYKEGRDEVKDVQTAEQNRQSNERLGILAKNSETMARNAATAETRAAKDSTGRNTRETTMDLNRKLDVAKDDLAEQLGVNKNSVNEELARLQKRAATDPTAKAKLDGLKDARDAVAAARQRVTAWEAKNPITADVAAPAAPADAAAPPKPNISSVQGAPAGSVVGSFVAGRGYEVKDRTGKVLGYVGK